MSAPTDIFYHWAPAERRKRICRVGLVPHQWSTDKLWKPPYVCLANSAALAWSLSGGMPRGQHIADWELWEVWVGEQKGYEELYFDSGVLKEIRVYERIYKRNVEYIGGRSNGAEKRLV